MEPFVKPKEEIHLDFAGLPPDEFNKDSKILVAKKKQTKFITVESSNCKRYFLVLISCNFLTIIHVYKFHIISLCFFIILLDSPVR